MLLSIGNKACIADYEVNSNHVIFTLSDNVKSYLHFSIEQLKSNKQKITGKTIQKLEIKIRISVNGFFEKEDIYSTYN